MSRIKLLVVMALVGMFLLSACGANQASANSDGSVGVTVTLKDFTVESSVTTFKPGVLYHFTVTNEGPAAHEFMIMPITMNNMGMPGMTNMTMEERDQIALMMIPQEQLPAGATVKMDYTFASVPEGNIEIVCTLQGHFEAGMHIPVTIK